MGIEERSQRVGLVGGLVAFIAYWVIVLILAAGDGLAFTQVAWQGPMLVVIIVGGVAYGAVYGMLRWRARGTTVSDERDHTIAMYAESAGAGLTGLAVLATLILLALDVDSFWPAHVLFVGAYLGSLISGAVTLAAYREGVAA